MRLSLIGLFFISAMLIIVSGGAQTQSSYDSVVRGGNLTIGLRTNAPASSDPLTYQFKESMDVIFFVFDPEVPGTISTRIDVSIRASKIGSRTELVVDMTTSQMSPYFEAQVPQIIYGGKPLTLPALNFTDELFGLENVVDGIKFEVKGAFISNLQPLQVADTLEIFFSNFSPKTYETGPIPMSDWNTNFLPLSSADVFILPLAAIGASIQVFTSKQAASIHQSVEDTKSEFQDLKEGMEDTLDVYQDQIDLGRKAKEGSEIVKDVYDVSQEVTTEGDTSWINRWVKFSFSFYFLFLIGVTSRLLVNYTDSVDTLLVDLYTGYTSIFLGLLLLYFMLSFLRPSTFRQLGQSLPISHVVFIVVGLVLFIILPLSKLISLFNFDTETSILDFAFLGVISMSFVITSLFAGYYLAKSGLSWVKILEGLLTRLRVSKRVINLLSKLVTLAFFLIVLIKLSKTISIILTVLLESNLSSNAYLVTLAASYLKAEAVGSVWIVYGLIMIFFIQTVMSIFLHLRRDQVKTSTGTRRVYQSYRRLAVFLLIGVISFVHLVLILKGKIEDLGLTGLVYPVSETYDSQDVFNVLFLVPPFKILLDILLSIGLIVTLPFAIREMWVYVRKEQEKELEKSHY